MTDRPSRRRDLVPVPTADTGSDGDDARRPRRRSRQTSAAPPTDASLTSLPVPAAKAAPAAAETASAARSSRRKRDDGATEKIHLQSEPVEIEDLPEEPEKAEKDTKHDPVLEKFRRETSTYSDYAFRLIFSRAILVIALLCFGWALWQAFHAVVTNYFRNLSSLPYPDGSLSLVWAVTEIANLAPLWIPSVS